MTLHTRANKITRTNTSIAKINHCSTLNRNDKKKLREQIVSTVKDRPTMTCLILEEERLHQRATVRNRVDKGYAI